MVDLYKQLKQPMVDNGKMAYDNKKTTITTPKGLNERSETKVIIGIENMMKMLTKNDNDEKKFNKIKKGENNY